jgi:hypothetical protein
VQKALDFERDQHFVFDDQGVSAGGLNRHGYAYKPWSGCDKLSIFTGRSVDATG